MTQHHPSLSARGGPRCQTKANGSSSLVLAGATTRGSLVLTFAPRFGEASTQLASWAAAGQTRTQVDIMEGLERAPEALRRLFTGENIRKQLVKIADAP